jgi:hypothetical protein
MVICPGVIKPIAFSQPPAPGSQLPPLVSQDHYAKTHACIVAMVSLPQNPAARQAAKRWRRSRAVEPAVLARIGDLGCRQQELAALRN